MDDQPTRRLEEPDPLPEHPTRRLPDSAAVFGATLAQGTTCPECGGPLLTTHVRLGTGNIVVERLDASARDLLL